jgi:hypothetical protein
MYFKTRDLFYDRRKNYYKNMGKKASQIISLPFLSQCLISVLFHWGFNTPPLAAGIIYYRIQIAHGRDLQLY